LAHTARRPTPLASPLKSQLKSERAIADRKGNESMYFVS
jgi:hypothetical protein